MSDPFDMIPAHLCQPFEAAAGALLFRTGDAPPAVLRVSHGRMALLRVTEEGHPVTIAQAGPGETLAEASIFAACYHCDGVALTAARGVRVPGAVIRQRLRSDPDFAEALVQRLSFQVRRERLRSEIMSIRSARERCLAGLSELGQSGTVTAFAAEIGLTQAACSRALAELVAGGRILRTGRGRYAIR